MNLIINERLDRVQEQAIRELTLKKRRSKKSTMTEKHMAATQQLANELNQQQLSLDECRKDVVAKVSQIRLEQLNIELERRLRQYEYLVEQEKALLGIHNVSLFTNKGVNNFHFHELAPTKC